MTLPAYRASRMAPPSTGHRAFWLALVGFILSWVVVGTVLTTYAHASTRTHCVAVGRTVKLSDARVTPDVRYTVHAHHGKRLSDDETYGASDLHAYPVRGGSSQQYVCTDSIGVRTYQWRDARGNVIASYDGQLIHASRTIVFAVWWENTED